MEKNLRVVSTSSLGKTVVAYRPFKGGEIVAKLQGQLCLWRTRHSIETQYGHVEDPIFSYMNHSKNPNVLVMRDGTVVARSRISVGNAITSDYTQHETCIEFGFTDAESREIVAKPC